MGKALTFAIFCCIINMVEKSNKVIKCYYIDITLLSFFAEYSKALKGVDLHV